MQSLVYALSTDEYLIGMGFLITGVIWSFFASFRFLRHARLLEDIPTSRIRSAPQGYVELVGTAILMDGPPIICPLSNTHCLWWSYEIERHVQSGKRSYWQTIEKGISDDLFYLQDSTGRCVIDPSRAQVIPSSRNVWYGNTAKPLRGPTTGLSLGGGGYRYTEKLIKVNDPLYVLGQFRTERGPSPKEQEQEAIRDLITQWKGDPKKMAIFDINKDGEIDAKEWDAAHRAAVAQVKRTQIKEAPSDAIHIMSRPEDKGYPYVLSTQDQAQLVPKWKRNAAACFTAFIVGGSLFIYGWIVRPPLSLLFG